jgi:hypothetical protein
MEISSNNKPKRGRPKKLIRHCSDLLIEKGYDDGEPKSKRSELNWYLFTQFVGGVKKADEATQLRIFGCTWQDLKNGTGRFPLGMKTASIEIARWIGLDDELGERTKAAVDRVDQLLAEKFSWREIETAFKENRIGSRPGNSLSLVQCLTRAINDYLGKHPSTTQETVDHAIEVLYVLNLPNNRAEAKAEALHLAGAIKGTQKNFAHRGLSLGKPT